MRAGWHSTRGAPDGAWLAPHPFVGELERAGLFGLEHVARVHDEPTAHRRLGALEVEVAILVPLGRDQQHIGTLNRAELVLKVAHLVAEELLEVLDRLRVVRLHHRAFLE